MKRPIVVGVDGSTQAVDAVALGRLLSESLDRPLLVASCYGADLGALPRGRGAYDEALRAVAERQLDDALTALDGVPVCAARAVATRSPVRGLTQVAEDVDAIAIVIGSSHRGAVGRTMAGSVGERLIQTAPCAVAIAPRSYVDRARLSTVGVAYDGSPEAYAALLAAATVAAGGGARLRIVSVLRPLSPANPAFAVSGQGYTETVRLMRTLETESLERAAADVAGDGTAVETKLLEGDIVGELLEQSTSLDLLTVGSRGYGALRRVGAGAVSIGVLRDAACPVLVLPRGVGDPFEYDADRAGKAGQRGGHEVAAGQRRVAGRRSAVTPQGVEGGELGVEGAELGVEGAELGVEGAELGVEGAELGVEGAEGTAILLCDDGSPDAEAAADATARLFPGAAVTVIAVWEPFNAIAGQAGLGLAFAYAPPAAELEEIDAIVQQRAQSAAEVAAARLRACGVTAHARAERERVGVSSTILAVAAEIEADAIVLGTRGRGGIKSFLLGSVSHAVLENADRPTLVIPSPGLTAVREPEVHEHGASR